MSKESFRYDVVLHVEVDAETPLNPQEIGSLAEAVSAVLGPYGSVRDVVLAGLEGRLASDQRAGRVNAWFELPWEQREEAS